MRAALGLGHHRIDDAELEAVSGVGLERRSSLLRLSGIAPEDRGATLRRNHRIDRVLLHEHAVCNGDRDRATRSSLTDDAGDARHAQAQHRELRAGDPTSLAVLLRDDTRIGARRVHERDDRESVAIGDLHRPHRLPVSLRIRHPEVAVRPLTDVAALLVADERDRPALEAAEARDERRIVAERAVAVQLDEVVENALDVIEGVRPVLVARELDRLPDVVLGRFGSDPVDLTLQAGHLTRDADSAQ
jgi:hypothetical protein